MGTAQPRKFSEKIAIMERKQHEDEAQFLSVMKDVRQITLHTTSNSNPSSPLPQNIHQQSFQMPQNSGSGFVMNNMGNLHNPSNNTLQLQSHVWNGVGGSLPNVNENYFEQQQLPQNNLDSYYGGIGHANNTSNNTFNTSFNSQQQHHIRSRSPGAPSHYHPYITRNQRHCERQSTFDGYGSGNMNNSYLVPPDNHQWKARSDSAIHVHPTHTYHNAHLQQNHLYNYDQLSYQQPQMQMMANSGNSVTVNGFGGGLSNTSSRNTSPIPGPLPFPNIPYDGSIISSPVTSPQYPQHANFSTVSSAVCTPSTGSPISTTHDSPTNAYGNASFSNCATNEHQGHQFPQVMHQQVCNSASMPTQMSIHQQPQINQAQVQVQQQQQQQPVTSSNGYTIYNQNLISPYNGDSYSQSAPNSPANLRDNSNGQIKMWPPRNYSTSPDLIDIPNIVLTGVDGNLDCYQNLDPTLFHLNQSNVTDQTTPSLLN